MMEVNEAVPEGESIPIQLNTTWRLDRPNSGEGLRYRQQFTLALPTAGLAEELIIDASTSMCLKARHLTFNALDGDAPEHAQVQQADPHGLRVTLPVPRLISSIRFSNALSPGGKTTQLFRSDGDVISDEAVASYLNRVPAIVSGSAPEIVTGLTQTTPANVVTENAELQEVTLLGELGTASGALPPGELGVVDGRIVVRLLDNDFESLAVDSMTAFNLTTGPENLRVVVRLPALDSDNFFLPSVFALNQQVEAGAALGAQLGDLVKRLRDKLIGETGDVGPPPVLPDPLEIEITVESDAPCRFTISQFAIRYRLARQSFPDGAPKQVMKFADDNLSRQQLGFEVPSSVTLTQAVLRLAGDSSAPVPGDLASASSGQLSTLLATAGDNGLRLDKDHRWASPLELFEPILSGGWDLLLCALAPNTQLHLDIVPDNNGTPGGERLASADAFLAIPGKRQLLRFEPVASLLVQPGTYWLVIESRDGAAVWYLKSHAGARVLQQGDQVSGGKMVVDQVGIANWVASAGPSASAQRFPEITLAGKPLPLTRDGTDWVYDMVQALGTTPNSGSDLLAVELGVLASGSKPLTIYAPRIEFEL